MILEWTTTETEQQVRNQVAPPFVHNYNAATSGAPPPPPTSNLLASARGTFRLVFSRIFSGVN